MPTRPVSPVATGTLCVIGGAEDRVGDRAALTQFVSLAGGPGARLAVVATASSLGPEIFTSYREAFGAAGVHDIRELRPVTRDEAESAHLAAQLEQVDGIFMTGGNQLVLAAVIAGTRFGATIHSAYARGAVVGGTSAGASIVSEHMVAFGDEGDTPRQGIAGLAAGLGLLPGIVVDQHFHQRSRYGRLLSLVARSPSLLGLGVDEDTAAIVRGGRVLEVAGSGCAFVVDGRSAVSDGAVAAHGAPLLVSGAIVHSLPAGARFDLAERRLISFEETHPMRTRHLPEES